MSLNKSERRLRIKRGIRNKISGTAEKPRLSVFRSNKSIYAQLIDDASGKTIMSFSTSNLDKAASTKVDTSKAVGKGIAEKALEKGISEIVFDRSGYLYHGRVKSLAEGAREAGLKF